MKKLYLMRHGQTRFNLRKKVQGASDSPLTQLGIAQARHAGAFLAKQGMVFDGFYTSTQERACDSMAYAFPGQDYTRLKGIKEWDFGYFEGENVQLMPKMHIEDPNFNDFFVPYDGESIVDLRSRMRESLTEVMEMHDCVFAVSHGEAMNVFTHLWVPYGTLPAHPYSNCTIGVFEYHDGVFHFVERLNPLEDFEEGNDGIKKA